MSTHCINFEIKNKLDEMIISRKKKKKKTQKRSRCKVES